MIISAEGKKTEVEYFECLKNYSNYIIEVLNRSPGRSSPTKVLDDLKQRIGNNLLTKKDEAWIVIDVDQWLQEEIDEVINYVKTNQKYHCAISNPKFEYWLLLHFEYPNKSLSSNECNYALKKYIPYYNKGVPSSKITKENIREAIKNARRRHNSNEYDYPKNNGTTVYLLVEKIIEQ